MFFVTTNLLISNIPKPGSNDRYQFLTILF
jgi:hypothetical protein